MMWKSLFCIVLLSLVVSNKASVDDEFAEFEQFDDEGLNL